MVQQLFTFYWDICYFVALIALIFAISVKTKAKRRSFTNDNRILDASVLSIAICVAALLQGVFYLIVPNFSDYVEPMIPALAGNLLHGWQVYSDWKNGHAVVGSMYGPYVFIAQLPALILAPSIVSSKLTGIVFAIASIACLFLSLRTITTVRNCCTAIALAIALYSFELHYWFWIRPDTFLLAVVSFALLLRSKVSAQSFMLCLGALAGFAIDLKIFAPLYLVPLFFDCVTRLKNRRSGLYAVSGAAILFIFVAALPFADPAFSPTSYVNNILLMPNQGYTISQALDSIGYGIIILFMPFISWNRNRPSGYRALNVALVFCCFAVAIFSGRPGGGTPYMMPFIPSAIYFSMQYQRGGTGAGIASEWLERCLYAVVICSLPIWSYSFFQMAKQEGGSINERAAAAEAVSIFQRYPGAEMGTNFAWDDKFKVEQLENFRVEKAFLGQEVRFDYVNFADQRTAGLPGSSLYPLFENCSVPAWILPRYGDRFNAQVYEIPLLDRHAFSLFYASYELDRRLNFYEVWRCRRHIPA